MTRYIRWQILLILLGVILVGILLAYLSANYTIVLRPGRGGTYVEGVAGFPRYLNPLLLSSYEGVDRDLCALLFNGLTRFDEHGEVVADLARGWDVTLDGLTYTFYLRSNAFWHDGTPVTADDVIFTIRLLQDPAFPGSPILGADVWRTVTVEKVDRHTVRFTLAEPFAPFLDYTTVGILPSHLLRGVRAADLPGLDFNLNPVGTGPFQMDEIAVQDKDITSIVLEQFRRYYGGRANLDRVQFRFYASDQNVLNAYEAGEVEGVGRIPIQERERVLGYPTLDLFSAPIARYNLIFLNLARDDLPFLQEPEVRQALLYGLDRQRIVDEVLDGQAVVVHSPILPGNWAYDEDIPHYDYDPEQAARLLDSVGWFRALLDRGVRHKKGGRLAFTLLVSSDPERVAAAQEIVRQWNTIGVTATVQIAAPDKVYQALAARDFDAVLTQIALPGDPDPYPFWHETQVEGGQNYSGLKHRRISEVLEQARIIVSRDRRKELYDEFQTLFAQEVPALLLYSPVYTYGVDERIHDVQIGPLTYPSDRFRTISDWWIVSRRVFVSESEARP